MVVRYGARPLEIVDGKNAIEADNIAGVIAVLEVLRRAVATGELDSRLETVGRLVKAGFEKEGPRPSASS